MPTVNALGFWLDLGRVKYKLFMSSGSGKTRKKLPNLNRNYLMNSGAYSAGSHF